MTQRRRRGQGMILPFLVGFAAVLALLAATLGSVARERQPARAEGGVLAEASAALLGYSASYPERVNLDFAPGYLPCPARDRRGIAGPACAAHSGTTRGLLPWHTLRTNDLRDSAGEALWYAVAPELRYNPKQRPLNAATPLSLTLDGKRAAAVVIAPGVPSAGQGGRGAAAVPPCEYLDGANCDGDVTSFVSGGGDRLLAVSAPAWRRAITTRALDTLARDLRRWSTLNGSRYPWLAPESARLAAPWLTAPVASGVVPYHATVAVAPHAPAAHYETRLDLSADFAGASISREDPDGIIPARCAVALPCLPGATTLPGTAACEWRHAGEQAAPARTAYCEFAHTVEHDGRHFEFRVVLRLVHDAADPDIVAPTVSAPRRRHVSMRLPRRRGSASPLSLLLTVRVAGKVAARLRVSANATTTGQVHARGLRYAMDVDRGELTPWLVDNQWLRLVHLAWREADCDRSASCLELADRRAPGRVAVVTGVRALLLSAGPPLGSAPPRTPGAAATAWFEAGNATAGTDRYQRLPTSRTFNDQLYIVAQRP